MPSNNVAAAAPPQPAKAGPVAHPDTTAKWFLISAICYFFIVGIIIALVGLVAFGGFVRGKWY